MPLHNGMPPLEKATSTREEHIYSSPTVQLYYRLYPDIRGRNRYICLAVKRGTDYSFILTGYLGRSIRGD